MSRHDVHAWFPDIFELAVKASAKSSSLSNVSAPPKGLHLGQNDGDTVGLREMATMHARSGGWDEWNLSDSHPHPPIDFFDFSPAQTAAERYLDTNAIDHTVARVEKGAGRRSGRTPRKEIEWTSQYINLNLVFRGQTFTVSPFSPS